MDGFQQQTMAYSYFTDVLNCSGGMGTLNNTAAAAQYGGWGTWPVPRTFLFARAEALLNVTP
jgi:hypothetical protein